MKVEKILNEECLREMPEWLAPRIEAKLLIGNVDLFGILQEAHYEVCFPAFHRLNDDQQEYLEQIEKIIIDEFESTQTNSEAG